MTAKVQIQETVSTNRHNTSQKEVEVNLLRRDKDLGLVFFVDVKNRNREYCLPLVWGVDYTEINKISIEFV